MLETIRNTCNYAVANEGEFKQIVSSIGADREQEAPIFLNYVGKIELPHEEVELTEEEKAEQEKEEGL